MDEKSLKIDMATAHEIAEQRKRVYQYMADQSNFTMMDAHGHPLTDENDPLLEALRRAHPTGV